MSYPPLPSNGETQWGDKFRAWADAIEEGKVEGNGLSLRRDTTVGERVFLDHPGGNTMLYGQTGWRLIELDDFDNKVPNTLARIFITREMNHVELYFQINATGASHNIWVGAIPIGFRPTGFIKYVLHDSNRSSPQEYGSAVVDSNGTVTLTIIDSASIRSTKLWTTKQIWPTALPGTPG